MVNGVPGSLRTGPQASQTFWETARELLCRNRHLFGTLKRVHCRRNRRDREGSEGGEPPRRTREVLQSLWPSLDCNRPRGGSPVPNDLCWPHPGGGGGPPPCGPPPARRLVRLKPGETTPEWTRPRLTTSPWGGFSR